jgi:hypothetical protein
MWEAYMAHQQGSWFETPRADRRWPHPELDPIDPSTIGRFNVTTWEQYSRDYHWMEGARRLLTQGTIKELEPQPTKEELPSVRCSEDARRFLGKLAQTNEGTSLLRPFEYPDVLKETCGLFLTPKKENTFRLIFDARRANARLERLNGFRLFTLDDLIHAMGNLMAKGPVYAWTCDFRHFFYQLGLARPLQQWFGIRGFGKDEIYFPNVWPMGFHSSPEVAQCVSWTAVLAREKDESSLAVTPPKDRMPTVLPIVTKKGIQGYIFVLLDNILVATDDKSLTAKWRERITRNIRILKLEVKKGAETGFVNLDSHTEGGDGISPEPGEYSYFRRRGVQQVGMAIQQR